MEQSNSCSGDTPVEATHAVCNNSTANDLTANLGEGSPAATPPGTPAYTTLSSLLVPTRTRPITPPSTPFSYGKVFSQFLNALEKYDWAMSCEETNVAMDILMRIHRLVAACNATPQTLAMDMENAITMLTHETNAISIQRSRIRLARENMLDDFVHNPLANSNSARRDFNALFSARLQSLHRELRAAFVSFAHCWIHEAAAVLSKQGVTGSLSEVMLTQQQPACIRRGYVFSYKDLDFAVTAARKLVSDVNNYNASTCREASRCLR